MAPVSSSSASPRARGWSGQVLTDNGTDRRPGDLRCRLAVAIACALAGLHLLTGWARWVSFGRPGGLTRAVGTSALIAVAAAGAHWRVESFREAHRHTHVVSAGVRVTVEQAQWAEDFYRRSLIAARTHGWFDYDTAMTRGFQADRVNRTHYPNLTNMFDGVILDPERPEWLIYYDNPGGGKTLMGFMFFTNKLLDRGPTPAGPLAQWHYHPYAEPRCAVQEIWTVSRPDARGRCAEGVPVSRTPEMFHVWFIDHPLGRFTEMNVVPEYLAGRHVRIRARCIRSACTLRSRCSWRACCSTSSPCCCGVPNSTTLPTSISGWRWWPPPPPSRWV